MERNVGQRTQGNSQKRPERRERNHQPERRPILVGKQAGEARNVARRSVILCGVSCAYFLEPKPQVLERLLGAGPQTFDEGGLKGGFKGGLRGASRGGLRVTPLRGS